MANELQVDASLAYSDSEGTADTLSLVAKLVNVTTKKIARVKQSIGTSEAALKLGDVSALGWVLFINRDTTNFVELRVATGGTKFAKLLAGECALIRLGSGITAPYAIADTAACQLEYLLISA